MNLYYQMRVIPAPIARIHLSDATGQSDYFDVAKFEIYVSVYWE